MLSQYQDARAAEITQDKAELHTPMQLYLFMVPDIYIYIYISAILGKAATAWATAAIRLFLFWQRRKGR